MKSSCVLVGISSHGHVYLGIAFFCGYKEHFFTPTDAQRKSVVGFVCCLTSGHKCSDIIAGDEDRLQQASKEEKRGETAVKENI